MFEDEELRSKYTRLGVEFKKLREKHKLTKDSLRESLQNIKLLEGKLIDQNVHVRNLEQEKESLLFRTQYLTKQATFLQSQLESSTRRNKFTDSVHHIQQGSNADTGDDALFHALQECSTLHEELVSQSAQFLERIALLESQLSEQKREQCPAEGLHSVAVQTTPEPQSGVQSLLPSARTPSLNSGSDSMRGRTDGDEEGDIDSLCTGSVSIPSPSTSSGALNVEFCPQSGVPTTTAVTDSFPTATLRAVKQPPSSSQYMRAVSLPTFALPNHSDGGVSLPQPSLDSAANNSSAESSLRERLLLHKIGQLERQVAEASLRCSLAVRRDKLARKTSNATTSSSISSSRVLDVGHHHHQQQQSQDPPAQDVSRLVDTDTFQPPSQTAAAAARDFDEGAENVTTLLCEVLQSQLAQCNRQLSVYAGRAACACEEVRNLYEHLSATRDQLESQRLATEAAEQKSRALEEELESTKMRTAQQLSEMALHMAHLTDEINSLRLATPTQVATRNKSSVTNGGGGGGGHRPLQSSIVSASCRLHSPVRPRPDGLERSISGSVPSVQEKMNSFFTSLLR
ncbi:hypothetical protein SprV_0100402700 [Sparganum proliferum]